MTSQKRYRHHQENNNGSARFRDLPPRFKRQKSSTSPTPSQSKSEGNTSSEDHKFNQENRSVITPASSTPEKYCSTSSGFGMGKERLGARADFQPQIPQMSTSASPAWQWQQGKESVTVLSQVDNRYNLSVNAQSPPPPVIPLGNHFGYRANSPPQSPWAHAGVSQLPVQPCTFSSQPWLSRQDDFYVNQMSMSPSVYNGENTASNQHYVAQCSASASWGKPVVPVHFQPTSPSSPIQRQTSPSPSSFDAAVPNVNSQRRKSSSAKGSVDYSDPDIRTIEMLRELERVADEKEADGDDFGVDRKSLVSHHLRMLMCAVDRYTEGVEDEGISDCRDDEVKPPTESPVLTPVPSPGPTKLSDSVANNNVNAQVWGQNASTSPMWKEPQQKQIPLLNHMSNNPSPSYQSSVSVPSHAPLYPNWGEQNRLQKPDVPAWDLWSSPSFDFCGVLSNQQMPEDLFNIFRSSGDLCNENEDKERKPLYQR